jgi:nucleotide-binding universal stress UspA family protein
MHDPSTAAPPDFRPVLVAVDASQAGHDAARWALDVAVRSGAELRLLHVAASPETPAWLSELAASLGPRATAEVVVDSDPGPRRIGELLAERTDGAHMLVVGSFGEGTSGGLLAGTVAEALTGATRCPLVVVRGPEPDAPPPTEGPVVVGVDATRAGTAALDAAADIAAALPAPLVVVHAWSDVTAGPGGGAHRAGEDWSTLAASAETVLRDAAARVAERAPHVEVETRALRDTPLRALLDLAGTARLVVVGPRSDHHVPRQEDGMLLGSTSRGLVGFAPCPVLVVPGTTTAGATTAST